MTIKIRSFRKDAEYYFQVEVPGVHIKFLDITIERYSPQLVQLFVTVLDESHPLRGKHFIQMLGTEYIESISCELSNGILEIVMEDPYANPVHLPIRHVF